MEIKKKEINPGIGENLLTVINMLFHSDIYENMPDYNAAEEIGRQYLNDLKAAHEKNNYFEVESAAMRLAIEHEQRGFMRGYVMALMLGGHGTQPNNGKGVL